MDLVVRCGRPHKSASVYFISMFGSCLPFWVNHLSKTKKFKIFIEKSFLLFVYKFLMCFVTNTTLRE